MKNFKAKFLLCLLVGMFACYMMGCGTKDEEIAATELDYTIVPDGDLPDALAAIIEEKKTGDMMLTYATESELYIVKGFGTRATDGYNIQVKSCLKSSDSIYFETILTGPASDSQTTSLPSYPYIVIKTEYINLPVVFQ
jgi:hypothetical protein